MPRALPVLLAALLTLQTGCATVSDNNTRGMMVGGGAAIFIGGVITADTLSCDDSLTQAQDCDEDRDDLIAGLSLLAVGAIVLGLGLYFRAHAAPTPAP